MRRSRFVLVLPVCLGCAPEPFETQGPLVPAVAIAPVSGGDALPVVRLRVSIAETPLEAEELGLFSGKLSDYHLGRIARRDLPGTLLERRVPVFRYTDPDRAELVVAPQIALVSGATYTLVTPRWGRLAELTVTSDAALPVLERVWPPRGAAGGGRAVLCGPGAPSRADGLVLEPSGRELALRVFASTEPGRACVDVRFDAAGLDGSEAVLPAELGGVAIDPAPLRFAAASAIPPRECALGDVAVGPGCARVEDDRATVTGPEAPLLWLFETSHGVAVVPAAGAAPFVLGGLEPGARQRLSGVAIALDGVETAFGVEVETAPPRPRLVLNEVLANPLGPESSGEWIEVVNAGRVAAELSGYELEDSGGVAALPAARVEPGEHVLIVREGFSPIPADVPPAPGTRLVAVPALGKLGLSNAGEGLSLWTPVGELESFFPALAAPRAGVSAARAADGAAFGEHAAPGASPGAPNQLDAAP